VDLTAYLAERVAMVDAALEAILPPSDVPPSAFQRQLHAAMRHLVFPSGKRLRPAFAIAAAEAVGGPSEAGLPMGVAVELIHTYSLVHDDLPCMDDDDERRGRPTVHVAYDRATAVLAGDALQSLAFEALVRLGSERAPERVADGVARLARAAGAAGLVGGQVDDLGLASEPGLADRDLIESIHARKTAALFRVALAGGALFAGASDADVAALENLGHEVGIAFQIADDLLDADTDEPCSILRVCEPETARELAQAMLERALSRVEGFGERAEPLRELARFAVRRSE